MGVVKLHQKLVYEFYEYLKQKTNNDKRQKLACLLGGIPFAMKIIHSTMSTLQETVYGNGSVVFNLHES